MSKIKLSDYIAKRLKEKGIKHFFMVSGGGAMHLNDSLGRVLLYTACHHEQACAIAAEGYARVNQKLAVVNVTTGPGGLNCLNGVFGQWTDSVPVLYISGQVKFSTNMASCPEIPLRQLGDQEVDIISAVKHLTKYSKMVTEPNEIKYHLDRAIYEATTGRFGPVWLDIPMNVQSAMIEEDELKEFDLPHIQKENSDLSLVIEKLKSSKRPLIVAGHGIRLAGQIETFKKLVEKLKIPVVTTFNGIDLMEDNNPYYTGRIGTIGQRAGNFALQNADLILCLGTRNNIRQVSYNWENFAKNAYKIVVDIDKSELKKPLVKPDLSICADLADFLPMLKSYDFEFQSDSTWLNFTQKLKEKYSFAKHPEQVQNRNVIEPYHFTYTLTNCLKENDIFVMANGSACVCTFQNAVIKKGQRFILNSGNASMGYGLPASVGASYEAHGKDVICLEGDGSIMMNLQELQTIVFNKLPIKLFVINNNGYSSIRQTQRNFFNGHMTGSGIDSGVSVPDFVAIGKAFGLKTKRIENPNTMEKEIKEVLNYKGAILCEVMVEKEYGFAPKLSAKKLPDGTMISPTLEDMYPFLDREEFEENFIK
ncbi:MAG: thiamine pyrophosphate-binding protein [Clostridiaceae bacterium]|jgi:acetolactate synthase I/II/III large subunit|nr:thiamine pyrophosphate-binding protein [Clostridiaceae bacterium]